MEHNHEYFPEQHLLDPYKFIEHLIEEDRIVDLHPVYYNMIDYMKLSEDAF